MAVYFFRLSVTGRAHRSQAAESNLRELCRTLASDDYEVEEIDTEESPERAASDHVMVTPTVLRIAPPPLLRVIGDLSDLRHAAVYLGFPDPPSTPAR